jgi:hypothetical protein
MTVDEKINRSFNLNYTSRRSSNSDTVADISASFVNPETDAVLGQRISTWLNAIFALPHHSGPPSDAFPHLGLPSGKQINTHFSLNSSSQRDRSGETAFDVSFSFENPIDRTEVYRQINIWLTAAGVRLEYKIDQPSA